MLIHEKIKNQIQENPVLVYMKGTAQTPYCGFSGLIVQILNKIGVPFKDINVLEDPEIRQGIKDYSNWPTIPQLYIKGEFIGGSDIAREMYEQGELQALFVEKGLLKRDAL